MLSKDMVVHLAAEPNPVVPLARKLKQFLGVETDEVSIDKSLRRSVFIKLRPPAVSAKHVRHQN